MTEANDYQVGAVEEVKDDESTSEYTHRTSTKFRRLRGGHCRRLFRRRKMRPRLCGLNKCVQSSLFLEVHVNVIDLDVAV